MQHLDESDPQRVKDITERALKDAEWVLAKVSGKSENVSVLVYNILVMNIPLFCFCFSTLPRRHELK